MEADISIWRKTGYFYFALTRTSGGLSHDDGDHIKVKLHNGRKVDATIRAVYQQDGETKLNIDYGHDSTVKHPSGRVRAIWKT